MSEEVKNATTNVARSMVYSVFINGVLAFGMLMGILFCNDSISAVANSPYPFVPIFAQAVGTNYGATAMASIVVVLQFCAATGALASASRLMWSFARDHGLPGWKFLRRVGDLACLLVVKLIAAGRCSYYYTRNFCWCCHDHLCFSGLDQHWKCSRFQRRYFFNAWESLHFLPNRMRSTFVSSNQRQHRVGWHRYRRRVF